MKLKKCEKTRFVTAFKTFVSLAFAFMISFAAEAETVSFAGAEIEYTNAEVSYAAGAGDLILTFKNTPGGSFSLSGSALPGRFLVVGGGGAGGTPDTASVNRGQGGGGGAGEFVSVNDYSFKVGSYSVTVGAGGAAATDGSTASNGNPGNSSDITYTTTSSVIASAAGGGGGGAGSAGESGGSGGGGSASGTAILRPTVQYGGTSTSSLGVGFAGGNGSYLKCAGGGGGAGGAGGATTGNARNGVSGVGGIGLQSDISGTNAYYAAGGGGGSASTDEVADGGSGIGGAGGGETVVPEQGEDGTGSGGGGGSNGSAIGGKGGDGVVIVRFFMPAIAPTVKTGLEYTGEEISALDEAGSNWDLVSGETAATNAGDYAFTIKPKTGLKWNDNSGEEERSFNWSIASSKVPESEIPAAIENLVYNTLEQTGVTPSSSSYYTLSGEKNTAAGEYTATATLNNPDGVTNCTWPDGSTAPRTVKYTIDALVLTRPTAKSNLTFINAEQTGIINSSDVDYYDLGGVYVASAVGDYIATATIKEAHRGSCIWTGEESVDTYEIEIPWSIAGKATAKPTAVEGLVYNGEERSGVVDSADFSLYTLSGVTKATNAGAYIAYATLTDPENYVWSGEAKGKDTIEISWIIASKAVAPVAIEKDSFEYDGEEKKITVTPAGWEEYSYLVGVTNATNTGTYEFRAKLKNPSPEINNYVWSDATTADKIFSWEITAAKVVPPTVKTGLKYTGALQTGVIDSEDSSHYSLRSGFKNGTAAADYKAEFGLADTDNYTWSDGTVANIVLEWKIAKADNAITSLKIGSWKAEENPVVHPVRVEALWKAAGEPVIDYSSSQFGPWEETQPTNIGVHYVRATVKENKNWLGAERVVRFSIWSDPDKIFRDYVDLKVQGYTGGVALTNFPLLVRISEERLRGFYYSRAGLTGEQLVFMDESENSLPYEVDQWNVSGESFVWVKLNVLTNNAPVRMYWALKDGVMPPGYTPEEVWPEYAGVWHFSEEISTSAAGGIYSADSTGNSNHAWPVNGNLSSSLNRLRSTAGVLGNARQMENSATAGGGCHLVVSNSATLVFGGKLTFSGWFNITDVPTLTQVGAGKVWPFSAREGEGAGDRSFGAYIYRGTSSGNELKGLQQYGSGTTTGYGQISSVSVRNQWAYFASVYDDDRMFIYGSEKGGPTFYEKNHTIDPVADPYINIGFGNIPVTNMTYASLCGSIDEYRISYIPRSKEWLKAEYETLYNTAFCTNSLVVKDGLKVNYWLDYPAFAPLALDAGEKADVIYNGVLAEGWASTNYVNIYDSTSSPVFPVDAGSYRVVFALDESFKGYELLEPEKGYFSLTLNGKTPYGNVQGSQGDSGRVLLMNRDSGPEGSTGLDVRYQGYCYNLTDRPSSEFDAPTFWEIVSSSSAGIPLCPNLKDATESIFWTSGRTKRLWHLVNCRHGNTMYATDAATSFTQFQTQNYLSWSPTSYRIFDREVEKVNPAGVGQIVMRNERDAAVYSSCFTNGIGTIYFDAVNGWNNNIGGNYSICVEVCSNVAGDVTHLLPPVDDAISSYTTETNELSGTITTNTYFYSKAVWEPVELLAYKNDNTPGFSEPVKTTHLDLAVKNGGTTTNFYRIAAKVNCRYPARFRIRRTTKSDTLGQDGAALILLDNIIVSYPAMSADLSPVGVYDTDRGGKQILGTEIASTIPFPAMTDTDVRVRAKPAFYVNGGVVGADTNNFVVAANLHYRWRYLRQRSDPAVTLTKLDPSASGYYDSSAWKVVPLNPRNGYISIDPISFPAAVGDIEFWYDLTMNTPYYEYVDYSGLGVGIPYTERTTAVTNHITSAELDGATILPTTGVDWFMRLREGKSDYESLDVIVDGAISGVYEMDVVEDNMWRALVKVPTNVTGVITVYFRGRNRQTPGATAFSYNSTYWGPASNEGVTMPANGSLVEYDSTSTVQRLSVALDHCTGYLEFKLSDRFLTWGLSRAEYQNFNNWSDAWSPKSKAKFCVVAGTNGVDDVAMKTHVLSMAGWDQFEDTLVNWNETFHLANFADPGFPKEVFYQDHLTPANWNGHNLTFVSKNLDKYIDTSKTGDTLSGIAAKILGQGSGYIEFGLGDRPPGLEKIDISARIGQSVDFSSMTYNAKSMFDESWNPNQNYLFFAPVLMSSKVSSNIQLADMAVGASVSVVAYYWPGVGCYEFRISRQTNNSNNSRARYILELFKWHDINGKIASSRLYSYSFDDSIVWNNNNNTADRNQNDPSVASKSNPQFYGMFISVENTETGTLIVGGVSQNCQTPLDSADNFRTNWNASVNRTTGGLQNGYRGIVYRDSDNPLTYGAYGVTAKDCPARFMALHHYKTPIPSGNIRYNNSTTDMTPPAAGKGKYFNSGTSTRQNPRLRISESEPIFELDDINAGRWGYQSRLQMYTNTYLVGAARTKSVGLHMPDDLKQDIVLQLQSEAGGEWVEYGRSSISGYAYTDLSFPLHIIGKWRTRVTTGTDNVDAVISSIKQYRWEAPNHEELTYGDDLFVYTQGIVETNTTRKAVELTFQPSRGDPLKPMSLRSPMLRGLGKVSFSYDDADGDAEVWVQIATNDVIDNVVELNTSTKEGPLYWTTVAKYAVKSKPGYDGTLASGRAHSAAFYLGLHNRADRPVRGLFRLYVPTNVVNTARAAAFKTDDVSYGSITITGMTVTDEPGLSERSWRGWNMRTIGDGTDEELRMYLPDTKLSGESGSGLVGALNNSLNDTDDEDVKTMSEYPTIFSPTFQITSGRKSGVGSVDFRARLYSTSDRATQEKGGKIWLYGAASSVDGSWTLLGEYEIKSSVFKTYSWQTGKENYLAVKFVIADSSAKTGSPAYDRIILDEITVREKVQPSVGFLYARPFRMNLFDRVEIKDILSPSEQPLCGESWGVQAQVKIKQLADEIDVENGFRVFLSYYRGEKPWGYENWKGETAAVKGIELVPVGDATNLVFRSIGTDETTLVQPTDTAGEIVQFQLIARYKDRGGIEYDQPIETYNDWSQPDWFYPIDKNIENGGVTKPENFSPYTILDTVSPGRAWINEVNFNDGTAAYSGGTKHDDNQFIEICVPSGVDMTGWKLRLTDFNYKTWIMAKFGDNGLPSSKVSGNSVNGYEFYLLESPETDLAGGINRDNPLAPAADGTWNSDGRQASADGGTLSIDLPYQIELIRPSGVIEHQFVLEGTNTVANKSYGWSYSGTNLVWQLDAAENPPSPKRFFAGREIERAVTKPAAFGSSGVVGGESDGDPAPGDEETWKAGLQFTPGLLNEGQIIPPDWFLPPNGTNSWVYLFNEGAHISQRVGTNTARQVVMVVPVGTETNVSYSVANWYSLSVEQDGETVASGISGNYVYAFTPTNTRVRIVATESPDAVLRDRYGIDEKNAYSPSVLKWLETNWPESGAEDIRLARFKGLVNTETNMVLSLTEMYWLDIPPVPASAEEFASVDGGSNWWLRAGITRLGGDHLVYRTRSGKEVCYTNKVVDLMMYISNSVTQVVYSPRRLQGLDNVRSDEWGGAWTSVTFKVRVKLDLEWETPFMPFRFFTFDSGSFTGASGGTSANTQGPIGPYSARIEILDPHSPESIGVNYGWPDHPTASGFFIWSLDTDVYPFGVEKLKYDDTYPDRLE